MRTVALYGNSLVVSSIGASLESPHTGERQSFTSLEQCFAFLRKRCSSRAGAPAQALNLSDLIELTRIRGGAGKEGYGER